MTTAPVAKTTAHRAIQIDLKDMWFAIQDWIKQVRASREEAKLEEWNMAHRAQLEARGTSWLNPPLYK